MISRKQIGSAVLAGCLAMIVALSPASAQKQVISGDIYTLEITVTKKPDRITANFVIRPARSYHCNLEYPLKLRPVAQPGITFSKEVYTAKEASVFSADKIVLTLEHNNPGRAGKATGELKMSFCDDKQCFMKKIPVEWHW